MITRPFDRIQEKKRERREKSQAYGRYRDFDKMIFFHKKQGEEINIYHRIKSEIQQTEDLGHPDIVEIGIEPFRGIDPEDRMLEGGQLIIEKMIEYQSHQSAGLLIENEKQHRGIKQPEKKRRSALLAMKIMNDGQRQNYDRDIDGYLIEITGQGPPEKENDQR